MRTDQASGSRLQATGPGLRAAGRTLLGLAVLATLGACSEGTPTQQVAVRKPVLSLVQTGVRAVEIRITGQRGLRALQATLGWDAATLRLSKVEPGRESKHLDRVFWNDPAKASGSLLFGLADTRQVQLPARGALVQLQLLPVEAGQPLATLRLESALGADEGGVAVPLDPVSAEVTLR